MATKVEYSLSRKQSKKSNVERVKELQEDALEAAIISAIQSVMDSTKFDDLDENELHKIKSVALQRFRSQIWPAATNPDRKDFDEQVENLGFSMSVKLTEKKSDKKK